jgi:PAS domain S-box-containing protein
VITRLPGGVAEIVVPVARQDSAPYGIALMRELLAGMPAAVAYLAGPDLIVEFANDAFRALVGNREVAGLPLRQALPELAAHGRLEPLNQIMRTGQTARHSETGVWVKRPGGDPGQLLVDFVCQPVPAADGTLAGILLNAADVTEHVRDQRRLEGVTGQLADSEERYRTLFETMPQGVVHYDANGDIIGVNPAAGAILGMDLTAVTSWPVVTQGQALREDGSPFPPEDLPVRVALRTGEVVADVVAGVKHERTGELRWLRVTAIPDARDGRGRPRRAYAIFTDLTEQRRTETALRESTALLGRLREANVLGVVAATEQGIYDANEAFLDIIGYSRDDLAAGRISYRSITAPEWAARDQEAFEQLRAFGAFQPFEKEYVHRAGHRVPVLVGSAVIDRSPLRWVTFAVDLSARDRTERERSDLLLSERAAHAEADSARERLEFLMRAGALVAATRDRDEMLEQVAQLVVPSLADYCVVFLPTADGMLRASALAHRDPARARVLADLREHPLSPNGPLLPQRAYTTGATQLARDVAAEMPIWAMAEPDTINVVKLMRTQSAIGTPLLIGQGPLGVIVLGRGTGRPRFATKDIDVIEELARRLGVGLANVDTFTRQHVIAETLQRAVLPDALPSIAGLDLAVRYLPATEGANIGGDWYDAFPLDEGRIGLVSGDVTGHSIASASAMGQVRSVLRAYAIDTPDPGQVLARTNTAMTRLLPDVLATAFYAVLDLGSGDLSYANAGHPPPFMTMPAGQTGYLDDTGGIMLGACPETLFTVGHRRLAPGTALLCYTDGLVESRDRDIIEGLAALAAAMRAARGLTAEQTCATVQSALLGSAGRTDDVCLLAARFTG